MWTAHDGVVCSSSNSSNTDSGPSSAVDAFSLAQIIPLEAKAPHYVKGRMGERDAFSFQPQIARPTWIIVYIARDIAQLHIIDT